MSGSTISLDGGGSQRDIIIDDAEFLYAESVLMTYTERLSTACAELSSLVQAAGTYAVQDQAISAGLQARAAELTAIQATLDDIKGSLNGQASTYIQRINDIDQFIY